MKQTETNRRFEKPRGYYLLEMMVGLFLFATIIFPLLSVFSNYYRVSGKARGTLVGSHLAERRMEEQLALGWQAQNVPPTPSVVTYIQDDSEISVTYTESVTVNDLSDPSSPLSVGMKQILVKVEWNGSTGAQKIELESLVYWGG